MNQADEQIMTVSHAEVGTHLLSIGGLPDAIVEAAAFHHQSGGSISNMFSVLTAVHLANAFVHQIADNDNIDCYLDIDYISKLDLVDRLPELREKCAIE